MMKTVTGHFVYGMESPLNVDSANETRKWLVLQQ
jgi:hypothetical protein